MADTSFEINDYGRPVSTEPYFKEGFYKDNQGQIYYISPNQKSGWDIEGINSVSMGRVLSQKDNWQRISSPKDEIKILREDADFIEKKLKALESSV